MTQKWGTLNNYPLCHYLPPEKSFGSNLTLTDNKSWCNSIELLAVTAMISQYVWTKICNGIKLIRKKMLWYTLSCTNMIVHFNDYLLYTTPGNCRHYCILIFCAISNILATGIHTNYIMFSKIQSNLSDISFANCHDRLYLINMCLWVILMTKVTEAKP